MFSHLNSLSEAPNNKMDSYSSKREFISHLFWKECEKLGSWEPFEDMNNENPVFWWFGNAFFKWRDLCFSAFSKYPFSKHRISLGEFLVHLFLLLGTIGANVFCGYTTITDVASKSTGLFAMISMILVFVFSGKMSIWNLFFGMPHERQLQFHKNAAWCMVISATVHGAFKGFQNWQGITGAVFAGIIILLFTFTINCFRRY